VLVWCGYRSGGVWLRDVPCHPERRALLCVWVPTNRVPEAGLVSVRGY